MTKKKRTVLKVHHGNCVFKCEGYIYSLVLCLSLCIADTYWHYTQETVGFPQQVTRGSDTPESGPCSLHSSALRLCGGGLSMGCKHSIFKMLKIFRCGFKSCQDTEGDLTEQCNFKCDIYQIEKTGMVWLRM